MFRVVEFILERYEGKIDDCRRVTVHTWKEAELVLSRWSATAPEEGDGYHKVGVWLRTEDKDKNLSVSAYWHTRIDLQREWASRGQKPFAETCYREWEFYSGRGSHPRMTRKQYLSWIVERADVDKADWFYRNASTLDK